MKPQKSMKKKTRHALITCTFSFVLDTVANMKRSSDIRTLNVNTIAKKMKKLSAELLSPTIKYSIDPKATQSIKICIAIVRATLDSLLELPRKSKRNQTDDETERTWGNFDIALPTMKGQAEKKFASFCL